MEDVKKRTQEYIKKYWCPNIKKEFDLTYPQIFLDCSLIDEFEREYTKDDVMNGLAEYFDISIEDAYIQFRRSMFNCFDTIGWVITKYYFDQQYPKIVSIAMRDLRERISDYNDSHDHTFQELFLSDLFQLKITNSLKEV